MDCDKLYQFYGVTFAMLLASDTNTVNSLFSGVSNSGRLVDSLLEEGKILRHNLYKSRRFRFTTDTESKEAQDLVKFTDFYLQYRRRLQEASIDGEIVIDSEAGAEVNFDFGQVELTGEFSEATELPELIDLNSTDAPADNSDVMLAEIPAGEVDITSLFDDNLIENDITVDITPNTVLPSVTDVLANTANSEFNLEIAPQSINERILDELIHNAAFYDDLNEGRYHECLPEIVNWEPEHITTFRKLNFSDAAKAEYQQIPEQIARLEKNIANIDNPESELGMARLALLTPELESLRKRERALQTQYEFYDETLRRILDEQSLLIPMVLGRTYTTITGETKTLKDWEYTLISGIHHECQFRIGGIPKVDYLINTLKDISDKCAFKTPKMLHTEYSVIARIDTNSRIIDFNKKLMECLRRYNGQDYVRTLETFFNDCNMLLEERSGRDDKLANLVSDEYVDTTSGKKKRTLRPVNCIQTATEHIMSDTALAAECTVGTNQLDRNLVKSLLQLFYPSEKIVQLLHSRATFAAMYKIWHYIHHWSPPALLYAFGVKQFVEEEELIRFTEETAITGVLHIAHLMFYKASDISVRLSNFTDIHVKRNRNMYTNIVMVRRDIASKMILEGANYERVKV